MLGVSIINININVAFLFLKHLLIYGNTLIFTFKTYFATLLEHLLILTIVFIP